MNFKKYKETKYKVTKYKVTKEVTRTIQSLARKAF